MKKMTRILSLTLAVMMVLSMACVNALADDRRTITIGVWWDIYYDSTSTSLEDDPGYGGKETDELRFNVVKEIEDTYGVNIEYVNMTYAGVVDSINTSILAGTPDCDIYMVELQYGVPAAFNGYAMNLHDFLPEDSDLFTTRTVMQGVPLSDDGAIYLFKPVGSMSNTYPMMYNKQIIEDEGLEDPWELYQRGEWTWDKFLEYAIACTKDNDGDGVTDQWGYDAFTEDQFSNWIMSNGTYVAATPTENFSSAEVGEALQMMQDLGVVYKCAIPYNAGGDDIVDYHRYSWKNGNVAFTLGAAWMMGDSYMGTSSPYEFDMVYVPWPVGPHGDKDTNAMTLTGGHFYFIPVGVQDPELVYNVFYTWQNWYHGDVDLRDDPESLSWWAETTAKVPEIQQHNLEVQQLQLSREALDLWQSVGVGLDWEGFMNGDMTVAQFQETYKQQYQDGLDAYFN